jgi:hypothetical protein
MLEVESRVVLPPEPGAAGDVLLNGYDVDGDGMRDDVQRYLEFRYWNEPKLKAAYRDFARARLEVVAFSGESGDSLLPIFQRASKIYRCMSWLTEKGSARDYVDELKDVESRMFNTFDRLAAYYKAQAKMSGIWSYDGTRRDKYDMFCVPYGLHQ